MPFCSLGIYLWYVLSTVFIFFFNSRAILVFLLEHRSFFFSPQYMVLFSPILLITFLVFRSYKIILRGFPAGSVIKNPPAQAGDTSLIPYLGGSHMLRSRWASAPQLLRCAREPGCRSYWTHSLQLLKSVHPRAQARKQEKPPEWEVCTPQHIVITTHCN